MVAIKPGDIILVHSMHSDSWADGTILQSGERGWLPTNYCRPYTEPLIGKVLDGVRRLWATVSMRERCKRLAVIAEDSVTEIFSSVWLLLVRIH